MNIRLTLLMLLINTHASFGLHVLIRGGKVMHSKSMKYHLRSRQYCSDPNSGALSRRQITYLEKIRTESITGLLLKDILDRNAFLQEKLNKHNGIIRKCLQEDPANLWRYKNELYWAEKELQLVAKD